jgi:hypothetical protein
VQLEVPAAETYHFTVYNTQGVAVNQRSYSAQAGINYLQLDLSAHNAAGMYMVAVRDKQGVVVSRTRIIVQ